MKIVLKCFALSLLCLAFSTQKINAQLLTITNVTIPSNATACTNTDIIAFVQVNCINFPFDSIAYDINVGVIDVRVYYQELFICLGALNFTSHTANLGFVPGGTYTVNVTGYLNMATVTTQTNTVSGSMSVTSCCNAIPGISYSGGLCKDDSILFTNSGSGAISQEWYIDNQLVSSDSSFYHVFSASGNHDVQLIVNGTACVDSLSQIITVNDLPIVNLGPDTSFCEGDSILISAGNTWSAVNWSNGSSDDSTFFTAPGIIFVEVTDQNGCRNADTISLTENPEPELEFGSTDTLICIDNFPVTISATGLGLSYLWHDGSTDSTFTLNATGWAACTVTGAGGCNNYDSIFVIQLICDGLESDENNDIYLYPNPATDVLKVFSKNTNENMEYKIYDLSGKLLIEGKAFSKNGSIDIRDFSDGEYLIKIKSSKGLSQHKIIIQ
jgi:hypothetical protein